MFILRVSTSVAMGLRAHLGLKYLAFFTAGKIDFHFGGALRVRSMFPVLL
jgi:hypothetical protein